MSPTAATRVTAPFRPPEGRHRDDCHLVVEGGPRHQLVDHDVDGGPPLLSRHRAAHRDLAMVNMDLQAELSHPVVLGQDITDLLAFVLRFVRVRPCL